MNITMAGRKISSAYLNVGVRCGNPPATTTDQCLAIGGPKANCTEIVITPAGLLAKLIPKYGGGEKLIPLGTVSHADLVPEVVEDKKK